MDAREIVARALNVDRCGFDPDKPDEFDYHAADAVLAALTAAGLLDRTGSLMTRAAEIGNPVLSRVRGEPWLVTLFYGDDHQVRRSDNLTDALEAAIAAAEDGR